MLRSVAQRLAAGVVVLAVLVGVVWMGVIVRRLLADDDGRTGSLTAPSFPADSAAADTARRFVVPDSLLGRSRALRFAALSASEAHDLPGFLDAYGDSILIGPRMLTLDISGQPFTLFVIRPFAHKRGEMVGPYRLGLWPAERWMMADNYLNPDGFVEVTPSNTETWVSEHFRLSDFLTRDQTSVWPKFVLLEERLIDKLELILGELARKGIDNRRAAVLSGFRAPYYNDRRIDEGAARASRHQFGDAADIIIDADFDGRMDDLNRDGRLDLRDLTVIGQAVAAVEQRHPELVGGLGTYAAMGPSGPFAHIDVRGTSARWERAQATRPPSRRP
jgi:uncharacterized protein YcbK (DUF882 family)